MRGEGAEMRWLALVVWANVAADSPLQAEVERELSWWWRAGGGSRCWSETVLVEQAADGLGGGCDFEPAYGAAALRADRHLDLEHMAEEPGPRLSSRLILEHSKQLELLALSSGVRARRWRWDHLRS